VWVVVTKGRIMESKEKESTGRHLNTCSKSKARLCEPRVESTQQSARLPFAAFVASSLDYNSNKCKGFLANARLCLDNCDDVFLALAQVETINEVVASLANAASKNEPESERIDFLLGFFRGERQHMAKWPRRSTSVTSNLYHQCKLSAIAEIIELMEAWRAQ
jgi:hypothetical protein